MANPSSSMNGAEDFLATDINALSSVSQSMEFDGSDSLSTYNLRLLPSNGMVEQIHSFPEMVSVFGLSGGSFFTNALCTADYTSNGINIKGKKRKSISDCDDLPPKSPRIQIFEDYEQNEVSHKSFKSEGERDVKKQNDKLLHCPGPTKSNVKQTKEISKDDADPKEAYIHVRAKRGKATNSHSLAERVRREKISERMRILQDIVPGCNKITGKAVMLDEIINYVQSLQQQVQFLSMKLSAVNPELNFDIEQIFSKVARDRTAFLGLSPGFSTSYAHCHGTRQNPSEMLMATTISQLSSMAQIENIWDEEIQNAVEMTFTPPQLINNYGFRVRDSKVG